MKPWSAVRGIVEGVSCPVSTSSTICGRACSDAGILASRSLRASTSCHIYHSVRNLAPSFSGLPYIRVCKSSEMRCKIETAGFLREELVHRDENPLLNAPFIPAGVGVRCEWSPFGLSFGILLLYDTYPICVSVVVYAGVLTVTRSRFC